MSLNSLSVAETNAALAGTEWLAVDGGRDMGFNLVQLDGLPNSEDPDLELYSSTDALPVVTARVVSGGVEFILAAADMRSEFRKLFIKTVAAVDQQAIAA